MIEEVRKVESNIERMVEWSRWPPYEYQGHWFEMGRREQGRMLQVVTCGAGATEEYDW